MARSSADRPSNRNVEYTVGNALDWSSTARLDAVCMLNVLHHLPISNVPRFLTALVEMIKPGGTPLLEEVSNRPRYRMPFTLLLDRLVVKRHQMNDALPYPHVLYTCGRDAAESRTSTRPD